MSSYQVRGAHRYNRLVKIRGPNTPSVDEFHVLITSANKAIESEVENFDESWDGFKKMEMETVELRFEGDAPRFSWYSWMRRWYIAGDENRPTAKQVDMFFIFPDLLVFRGEASEVDRAFERLKSQICNFHEEIKLETVPFGFMWFMWLFENAPLRIGRYCELLKITDIRLIGGEQGFEGQDIREYKSVDVTRSLFTAIALLLRRDIAGITFDMKLGPDDNHIRCPVEIVSEEDDGIKRTYICETLATKKPTRGAFYLPGGLTSNQKLNNKKFIEAMIIAVELTEAFQNWANLPRNKQVPTDEITDKLKDIVEDAIEDILVEGPRRVRKWLREKRKVK